MICFPLDNTPYEAKDMGAFLATRTRGVFSADGNLAVTPGENGLSVCVSPGLAWLRWSSFWGVCALQEQTLPLALDAADGVLRRIDTIVCRLDKVNNRAEIVVKKGAFSSDPVIAPPVRDANYDELYLAAVQIGAGAIGISASDITDLRLDETYCGLMRDGVTGIPTQTLHAQWAAFFARAQQDTSAWQQAAEAGFTAWLQRMQELFAEDPAGSLQTQLDALSDSTQDALAGKAAAMHTHTKSEVGLGNVNNTADSEKSVKYAAIAGAAVDQTARNAAAVAQTAANTAQTAANARMPYAGGTFTGHVAAPGSNTATWRLRNAIVTDSGWSPVSSNSIWFIRK